MIHYGFVGATELQATGVALDVQKRNALAGWARHTCLDPIHAPHGQGRSPLRLDGRLA